METLTLHQHSILTHNSKNFNEQITQNCMKKKKEQNGTLQISAEIHHSDAKSV
jgi:hypothetical protein